MLSILIPKIILKGAINTFIVKPAVSSVVSIIPSKAICDTSLLGYNVKVLTNDLYQYGIEKILDKFLDKKIEFKIKKLTRNKYEITPMDELARSFLELSNFPNYDRLIIEMSKFDKEIDKMTAKALIQMTEMEDQLDKTYDKMMEKLNEEERMVDEILNKQIQQLDNLIVASDFTLKIPEVDQKSIVKKKRRKRVGA